MADKNINTSLKCVDGHPAAGRGSDPAVGAQSNLELTILAPEEQFYGSTARLLGLITNSSSVHAEEGHPVQDELSDNYHSSRQNVDIPRRIRQSELCFVSSNPGEQHFVKLGRGKECINLSNLITLTAL